MKNKNSKRRHYFIISQIILMFAFAVSSSAQTTAFNFQGSLNDGANAANGNFEMQFKLYDSLAGGAQIGATATLPSVAVINGIFSTALDFGAASFDGAARFVEIGVRPLGNANPFSILNPRQQVLSSPYAIQAKNAAQLGGINASEYVTTTTVGSSFIKNTTTQQTGDFNISGNGMVGGNLGVGTTTPTSKLNVLATGYGITQTGGAVTVGTFVTTASGGSGWLGTRSNHPLNFFTNDGLAQMTLLQNGNFGIGTANPTTKMFVLSSVAGISAIYGESQTGRGVWGKSFSSRGVYGESDSLEGVYGISNSGVGVAGRSTTNSGVYGETSVSSLTEAGVYGKGSGSGSIGVIGEANVANAVGVYGTSTSSSGFGVYARNPTQPGGIGGGNGKALFVDGNAGQSLSGKGIVKVMIHFDRNGSIIKCFNGVASTLVDNCGGVVATKPLTGVYRINFGFRVDNRFLSITPEYGTTCNVVPIQCRNAGANFRVFDANTLEVFTFNANNAQDTADAAFMLILY